MLICLGQVVDGPKVISIILSSPHFEDVADDPDEESDEHC